MPRGLRPDGDDVVARTSGCPPPRRDEVGRSRSLQQVGESGQTTGDPHPGRPLGAAESGRDLHVRTSLDHPQPQRLPLGLRERRHGLSERDRDRLEVDEGLDATQLVLTRRMVGDPEASTVPIGDPTSSGERAELATSDPEEPCPRRRAGVAKGVSFRVGRSEDLGSQIGGGGRTVGSAIGVRGHGLGVAVVELTERSRLRLRGSKQLVIGSLGGGHTPYIAMAGIPLHGIGPQPP